MRRYEDMDDLLRRVRERLAVDPPAGGPQSESEPPADENYTALLNQTILLYHEAEQLRGLLDSGQAATLSAQEREELLGLIGKAAAAVADCSQRLH